MVRNFSILLMLALILALPFAFRRDTGVRNWQPGDPVLVIISPHNEAIRFEVITPERVRRFFAAQAKNYKAPTSLGAVVAALRGYFRWLLPLPARWCA